MKMRFLRMMKAAGGRWARDIKMGNCKQCTAKYKCHGRQNGQFSGHFLHDFAQSIIGMPPIVKLMPTCLYHRFIGAAGRSHLMRRYDAREPKAGVDTRAFRALSRTTFLDARFISRYVDIIIKIANIIFKTRALAWIVCLLIPSSSAAVTPCRRGKARTVVMRAHSRDMMLSHGDVYGLM